jgi:sulfate permease, SulP family
MGKLKQWLMPHGGRFHVDFLSGLTVALALIPEAIAFALVAGVNPLIGLMAAFFLCFITAVIGGRPGMISGATGSTAVVLAVLCRQYGLEYLFAAVLLTGVLEIVIGCLHWGKFIRMMPKSVMVGFVNGLAIVIFLAQLQQFKVAIPMDHTQVFVWLQGMPLYSMLGLVLVAMAITHYLPRFTKAIPAALAAIVTVSLVVWLSPLHTRVVQDMMGGVQLHHGLFPAFHLPSVPLSWHALSVIFPYAAVLAIIGLSESLMTLSLVDERTQTHGRGNRECIAQGVANMVCGVFQSMGGCAMIGQSMINVTSGGRGRLSGIVAGIFLLLFVLVGWPIIKLIPLAALVGVMFMVVIETFEWATFRFIRQIPLHDALIIVIVTAVTVFTNLAIAVLVGVIMASLEFAWKTAKNIYADVGQVDGVKTYVLHGPLFFGSTTQFAALFSPSNDADQVVIDFKHSRVADHSAIDAIKSVVERYSAEGKAVRLKHLSLECKELLGRAGDMVEVDVCEDPDYHVATDALD